MSSANYSAARQASPRFQGIIRGKSKLSMNYPAESFSISQKVKISLLKGLSLLSKLILDNNSIMDDQYYSRFGRKNGKYGITENNN
jgi:hypothetical protein